jgi:nucleoside-diphosphate-sugar epimerase
MSSEKRVLVTGAAGFIGRAVVRSLVRKGLSVVGTSVSGRSVPDADMHSLDLMQGAQVEDFARRIGTFGTIVHAAADVPFAFTARDSERALFANIAMTTNVGSLLRSKGRLVYISSSSVYGSYNEDRGPRPNNLYSVSKLAGEHIARVAASVLDGGAVSLRISAPYGVGQPHRTVLQTFVERAVAGAPLEYFGTGSRTQDFTHVDDVADAVVCACERGEGEYDISGGRPIGMRMLGELVVATVGRPGARVQPAGIPDPQEHFRVNLTLKRAAEDLLFSPLRQLEDGIRELAASVGR